MIEILGALVVGGVTGAIAKDKLIGNPQLQAKIRELEGIYKENNNLREDKKKLSYNPQNEAFLHSRTSRAISQNETYRRNTPYPPLKNRPAYAGIHIL